MLKNKKRFRIIRVLLLIITILYLYFLSIDIFQIYIIVPSKALKYLSIILVMIISLLTGDNALNRQDLTMLQIALFITLIADLLLLILNSNYILGVLIFSLVQIIYATRHGTTGLKSNIKFFAFIFMVLLIAYFILNRVFDNIEFIWLIAVFYAICLLNSVLKAVGAYRHRLFPKPNRHMIILGMILFLLCDINVGLFNVLQGNSEIKFFNKLYALVSVSMWLFYLPSQVLLSLSGYRYNNNSRH